MKNGLLIYRSYENLFNIGDYVQSLAASQYFSDKIDALVCREDLNNYAGDDVKIIMNGWFTHEPLNWPPSDKLLPLFVSFHINSVAKEELLRPRSIEYLKKFSPIGCRDKETARLLVEKGVDAFFSGCLTLTLGMTYKSTAKNAEVYFVDPYFEPKTDIISLSRYFMTLVANYKSVDKITKSYLKSGTLKNRLKMSAFYGEYRKLFSKEILENGIYLNQMVHESDFKNEEEKFASAKSLLNKYSKAKLVVTSRIHCALPCLALETPVIYVENVNQSETSFCRLNGLREFFNKISYDKGKMKSEFSAENVLIDKNFELTNKNDYRQFRDKLIEKCKDFVLKN